MKEAFVIYYMFLFCLYIIGIAYEYNSTSSFENGYIYIHCQWITTSLAIIIVIIVVVTLAISSRSTA